MSEFIIEEGEKLKVKGVLAPARVSRNNVIYLPKELERAVKKLEGQTIPIYIEHIAADKAVGLARLEWDAKDYVVRYEGEILDEEIAQKIRQGLIKHVSLGGDYERFDMVDGYLVPKDIEFRELSLVAVPGIPEANIEIVEAFRLSERKKIEERAVAPHETKKAPEEREWDADAAIARIRKWASSDGSGEKDKIDWKKYRQAFAWYDANEPENFGSYKLPHHDIIDGDFVVVWRGVAAAMAALKGARGGVDIPQDDYDAVYKHLAVHYKQFDKPLPEESVKTEVVEEQEPNKAKNTIEKEQKNEAKMSEQKIEEKVEQIKTEKTEPLPLFESKEKPTLQAWREMRLTELKHVAEAITNVPSLVWHSDLVALPPELAPDLSQFVKVVVLGEGEDRARFHVLGALTFGTITEGTEPTEANQTITTVEVTPVTYGAVQSVTDAQLETSAVNLLAGIDESMTKAAVAKLDELIINAVDSTDVTEVVYGGDATSENQIDALDTIDEDDIIEAVRRIKANSKFVIRPGDLVLVVHPKQYADLLKRDIVKKAMEFGGPEAVRQGVIPSLFGVQIVVSTLVKTGSGAGTPPTTTYHAIMFKKDEAVGLVFGRKFRIESIRYPEKFITKFSGSLRAAAKVIIPQLCCKIITA